MRRLALASLLVAPLLVSSRTAPASPEPIAAAPRAAVDAPKPARPARVKNPILGADHPDPDVLRVVDAAGRPTYYLTATSDCDGDIPIYTSPDLVRWTKAPTGAFARPGARGASMPINGAHFCSLWAPQLVALGPASYLLAFTGRRYEAPQARCTPYDNDSGVYFAWSDSPLGPFARAPHEPLPAGAPRAPGDPELFDDAPRSPLWASPACAGGRCDRTMRLDSGVFLDEATGRRWLAYSWYTESPPRTAWERDHHGEHVSVTELDRGDLLPVRRSPAPVEILAGDAHDRRTLDRLRSSCDRCGDMLSMSTDRLGEPATRDGRPWAVNEGAALFRRGGWVYLLMSGALWDSADYHVFWVAARSVEELAVDNPGRLVGRYLVPSRGQSFGHGSPVLGPDGARFYYVHHRLRADACRADDDCARDVWVSPIEFEDRGDGLGDVHIKARFPAEEPETEIALPG